MVCLREGTFERILATAWTTKSGAVVCALLPPPPWPMVARVMPDKVPYVSCSANWSNRGCALFRNPCYIFWPHTNPAISNIFSSYFFLFIPRQLKALGFSAQIGSGVVRGGPEVRFHEGSMRVLSGFHEVLRGLRGGASTKTSTACCWSYHLSLIVLLFGGFFATASINSVSVSHQSEPSIRTSAPRSPLPLPPLPSARACGVVRQEVAKSAEPPSSQGTPCGPWAWGVSGPGPRGSGGFWLAWVKWNRKPKGKLPVWGSSYFDACILPSAPKHLRTR